MSFKSETFLHISILRLLKKTKLYKTKTFKIRETHRISTKMEWTNGKLNKKIHSQRNEHNGRIEDK